jgi:PAS domain S-box-containing protein
MQRAAPNTSAVGPGESRFQAFAETAPDAIVTGDPDDRITYVNPAAERLFGYAAPDMVGQPLTLLMPARMHAAHHDAYSRYARTGEGRLIGTTIEVVAVRADGREFPIELSLGSAGPAEDRSMTAVIRDITVRRRRERHLAAQLAVTAVLAESRSAQETGARIVEQWTRALGWDTGALWLLESDGKLRVHHTWQADPAATGAFVTASRALALAPGEGLVGQAVQSRSPVWWEDLSVSPVFIRTAAAHEGGLRGGLCLPLVSEGRAFGAIESFTHDVVPVDDGLRDLLMTVASQTGEYLKRRETEERLTEARARFANAFVHAPIGMALVDDDGCWMDVNPALCEITGHARGDLLARAVSDIVHPDDADAHAALVARVRDGDGDSGDAELRLVRRTGEVVWVGMGFSRVRQPTGDYLIAQIQDVTAARDVTELRERNAVELRRSNAELEAFAHVAAHDLRTPLQTIIGFTQLIERRYGDGLPPEGQDFLRMVLESAEGSDRLLVRLLAYARAGGEVAEPVALDPQPVVDGVIVALASQIDAREARVDVGDLPRVVADPVRLGQVLQNLLGNAIKFTPDDRRPQVEVAGRLDGDDMVCLSVADRGIGVDPEESGEVFGMFRRGAGGIRYEGTGIGLAVAAKIVAGHGGRLWVEPREGGGSVFSFTLPGDAAR